MAENAGVQGILSPHDPAARSRALIRGIVSSFFSRGVAALAPLALIPLLMPALGTEVYGAWMTVVSITSMLVWADFGLGNGLLTRLAHHISRGDQDLARRDVATTYGIVTVVGLIVVAASVMSPLVLDWNKVLNASSDGSASIGFIAQICLVCFGINMPLSVIHRILYASQQVALSNAFTAFGSALSLGAAWATSSVGLHEALIVLATTLGPILSNVLATIWFFAKCRDLFPGIRHIQRSAVLPLLKLGGLFVLISSCSSIALNVDNVLIARSLGAESVAQFAVTAKVMASMGLLINLVNLPLWPATANALVKGDLAWVSRSVRLIRLLSAGFVLLATIAVSVVSRPLIHMLSHGMVDSDFWLIVSLGCWWFVVALTSPMMMVQNAAGVLRPQLIGWILFLLLSVPAKVLVIPLFGVVAVPIAGAIAYASVLLPFAIAGYRHSLSTPGHSGTDLRRGSTVDLDAPSMPVSD